MFHLKRNAAASSNSFVVLYLDHTAKISGGEVALLNLVTALDTSRFTPVVVLAADGPLVTRLRDAGIETHVLPLDASVVNTRKDSLGAGSLLRLRQAWACLRYALQLARWARGRGVSLIHTNSLKADLYGGLAGRLARIPVLWHVRDRIDDGYLPAPVAAAFRFLARLMPQMVVANSESTLHCLHAPRHAATAVVYSGVVESAPVGNMQVVHDGFNLRQFEDKIPLAAALSPSPVFPAAKRPIVALIGRIAPWKGQHIFLEAAAQVLRRHPFTRFWVVGAPLFGEHDYERSLHAQAERLELGQSVEFLGFQEDVPTLLAQSDVVVHASTLGEPFGQVVVEGMAAGKPVIATNGGALPEIVESGKTGLLVPMADANAMAEAIDWLLSDPARARAMGAAGQERAQQHFTIRHTARKMESVYDRLLHRQPGHDAVSGFVNVPYFAGQKEKGLLS